MSKIVESKGNFIFNFLRNLSTIFHNGCTNLQSHLQHTRVSFLHISLVEFLIAILKDVSWYLIMVLFAFLWWLVMLSIFFMCLLAICMSSLEKMSIQFLCFFNDYQKYLHTFYRWTFHLLIASFLCKSSLI